ncbi:MAG TPA: hypothetical protein VIU61_16430 [Kofleriaceae bacterium]
MLKWFIRRKLAAFEKEFGYDASYMHHVLDTDLGAFMKFARAASIGHYRKDVPIDVHYAVGCVGVVRADCGPCAQLGVTMALRNGVPGATIARILRGKEEDMTEPTRLGVRFARAVLDRDGAAADEARAELERRYGKRAIVSLGLALCASQLYPTFKWALGFGHTCQRIEVDGTSIVPKLVAA